MNRLAKKILALSLILGFTFSSFAQFKLSGKIVNYTGKEKLEINIPVISGYYKSNSTPIPISKAGTFSIILPLKKTKFANLIFQKIYHSLLLKPNQDLVLHVNKNNKDLKLLAGTALAQNQLMQMIDLEQQPFFLENQTDNPFARYSFQQLQKEVLQPYLALRDQKIEKVKASTLASQDKALLINELKYISYNYLDDFAGTQIINKPTRDSLLVEIFDAVDPKPAPFPAGPQYYAFVRNYLSYMEIKAFNQITAQKIKPNEPIPYFGISLDSATKIVNLYGKPYWRWIGSQRFFPKNVIETYNYHQLFDLYLDKDLRLFGGLAHAFIASFPNSIYRKDVETKLQQLQQTLAQNEHNKEIQIIAGYEKINSIAELIKPFKGKTIYLDIWGTWCGPCKQELAFVPALKDKFKGKDVVFIYLDLDDDQLDDAWRKFIKLNNMSGFHLRKTRQTIAPLWKELLADATDKAEYYPQYFIFNREGKLVHAKAKRPSDKEELYAQLENVLNKK